MLLDNFGSFCAYMSDPTYWEDFNEDLCGFMQHGPRNKAIVLPRGARKTTIATIRYSQWRAINNPNLRILWVFNTATNAEKKMDRLRAEFESDPRISRMFPEVIPNFRSVVWTRKAATLNRTIRNEEATFEAAGVSTALASRHYDIVIFDDPTSPEKEEVTEEMVLPSMNDIQQAIGKFKLATFFFDNPATAEFILVTTRWADNDIIDYVKKNRVDGPTHFGFFERKIIEDDNPLMPKRFPTAVIDQMRFDLGPYFFSCLCMNTPMEAHLRSIKPEWMLHWSANSTFLDTGPKFVTIDPAKGDAKKKGCHTGIVCAEHAGRNLIVHEAVGDYLNGEQTAQRAVDMVQAYGARRIGVEDVALQMFLEYPIKAALAERGITGVVVDPIKVGKRKKEDRIEALVPLFSRGQIFLPPDGGDLEAQLLAFPFTDKKDIVDAFSLQMRYYKINKALRAPKAPPEEIEPIPEGCKRFNVDEHWKELEKKKEGMYGYALVSDVEDEHETGDIPAWAF